MIGLDTNLLVYAHRAGTPEHAAARDAIQRAAEDPRGWGIPAPCLAEFWSIVTHAACPERPSTPREAGAFITVLTRDAGAHVWLPGPEFGARLIRALIERNITGYRVFDLQIALTAQDNGATEFWTHDEHFVALPGVRVFDPLATNG